MVGFNSGRCEHKYLVPEVTARALRGFVESVPGARPVHASG